MPPTIKKEKVVSNFPKTREELKSTLHDVLNEFPVMIYNGTEKPHTVTLPEGIKSLSQDVKTVKDKIRDIKQDVGDVKDAQGTMDKKLDEHTELLSGIKTRKKMTRHLYDLLTLIKKTTFVKVLIGIAAIAAAIEGSIQFISWLFPLIEKIILRNLKIKENK